MEKINVTQTTMPEFEKYVEEIRDLFESKWITNYGAKAKELEKKLLEYLDVSNISLFVNGHAALELAIEAFDFPEKGEVITTPFTFASTTHAIVRCGLTPVFCDINSDDFTIDTRKIEALINKNTVAILPVHVYGNLCDVEAITAIAKKHQLKVIYDAAHAFGETYKGKGVGTFGDISMFSFHATKVFNSIEGGALTYANPAIEQRLNELRNFGIHDEENINYVGTNAKMNEFQAAMGLCNLPGIEEAIEKRKIITQRYNRHFECLPEIKINPEQKEVQKNYSYYPIVLDEEKCKVTREQLMKALECEGIYSRKYFYPLTNQFNCYENLFPIQTTPIAKKISEQVLTLPLYPSLSLEAVDRIAEIILKEIK